jgi:hypothetical protein
VEEGCEFVVPFPNLQLRRIDLGLGAFTCLNQFFKSLSNDSAASKLLLSSLVVSLTYTALVLLSILEAALNVVSHPFYGGDVEEWLCFKHLGLRLTEQKKRLHSVANSESAE